jgi:glycosyltransferase involved in cell wall biosynthesis
MSSGITVVVPAFNSEKYIDETLCSILNQTLAADEIIVVDDCSTDGTVKRVRHYGKAVTLIALRQNTGGASIPRNIGIDAARSKWVAPLDADDLMLPQKLERQAMMIARFPDISVGFSDFALFGAMNPRHSHCMIYSYFKRHLLSGANGIHRLPTPYPLEAMMHENYVGSGALIVQKAAWKSIAGYDESMRSAEDMDFVTRLAERYDFGFVDEVLHKYRVRNDSKSSNKIRCYSHALATLRRYMSWSLSAKCQQALENQIQNYESDLAYLQGSDGNILRTIGHLWQAARFGAPREKVCCTFPKILLKSIVNALWSKAS